MVKSILIIGGTGAQGFSVVQYLSSTNNYELRCLTRDPSSSQAQDLLSIPHVTVVAGAPDGYDEASLTAALKGVEYVWVNTNGFAMGEILETFWGIRIFELAVRAGVKHLVYSGIEGAYKMGGYDPKYYVGHFEGKARVSEFMLAQPTSPMAWTVIDSAAYTESFYELFAPREQGGVLTLTLPLGQGHVPMICLADQARYVDWAFAHPEVSSGIRFAIATEHVSGADFVAAFKAVTGKPAHYQDVPKEMWLQAAFGQLPNGPETKIGAGKTHDSLLLQTYAQDFGNWFELYRATGKNTGLLTRDYEFLDKILPDRVKSLEEWMRMVGYTGEAKAVLKDLSELKVQREKGTA